MRHTLLIIATTCFALEGQAQQVLSLDSCRAMALRNNKTLSAARLQQEVAKYTEKAAKTKYLPHIDAVGGYELTSREISLLSKQQKAGLNAIGTNATAGIEGKIAPMIGNMVQQGVISTDQASNISSLLGSVGSTIGETFNQLGQKVVDAFRTDTRNMYAVSVALTQPIYMGGAISAANRMAQISGQMAANKIEATTQQTLHDIDKTYWLVVSLKHKRNLADSYLQVVQKLDDDVKKMISEGVATRADGLKVDVRLNEAEMTLTQAENGLALSKMLLCQLCGIPVETEVTLADENNDNLAVTDTDTLDMSKQSTRLMRASGLPQVALIGGYMATNPNVFNGFERNLSGVWNVGVMVRVPVWNWMETSYKVKASKIASTMVSLELDEAREKIELQVSQSKFKMKEAQKRLTMACKNVENAEENLRCANVGFKEGVMQTTDVMAAQTAWMQALSQKIDAEIDVKLSYVNLQKALGILQ